MSETNPWEVQEGGHHYKVLAIQPTRFIYENKLGFIEGNVIKYICRDKGNRISDLKKAKHYIEILIYEEEQRANAERDKAGSTQHNPSGDVQKSREDIYVSEGMLLGQRVVLPKYLDGGATERFSSVVGQLPTEIPKDNKEESGIKCSVDNLKHRLEVYYKTGV